MRKKTIALLTTLLGVSIFLLVWYIFPYAQNAKYNFTLQGDNTIIKLSDFYDKNLLIYFGYVSCPDVCPTTLYTIKESFSHLEQEEKDKLQVLFVSVDHERDKPKDIQEYASFFAPNALGATARQEEFDRLSEPYRLYFVKEESDSAMNYLISHTSYVYFFQTRNRFYKRISSSETAAHYLQTIREIL